uniref:STN domain-containing protein n=1 Tax=Phenylobacterium glaciei TaxID=2803784 RepID=A0A974S8G7_9CAUL|nr:STN domain-containing protein [Phenylobacterium glaciei]
MSALSLVIGLSAACAASAAPRLIGFHIAPQPLPAALTQLAIQAGVSISTGPAFACGPARGLEGRYNLEVALTRLLAGTGCGYRLIDAGAVEIVRLPPVAPTRPAAATPSAPVETSELIVVATRRPTQADRLAYAVSAQDSHLLTAMGSATPVIWPSRRPL